MTGRIASLAMYDRPELRAANDALWAAIAARLGDYGVEAVPADLERGRPLDSIWASSDLLLAQCCGFPLVTTYRNRLRVVAIPRYNAPDCQGATHHSVIVTRRGDPAASLADLRMRRAALNGWESNTGHNLFRSVIAPLAAGEAFFSEIAVTGSHEMTARFIADDLADVGAIDVVSYTHLRRYNPLLAAKLRILASTPSSPNLPLVTSIATSLADLSALRRALSDVVLDVRLAGARRTLLLEGFDVAGSDTYAPVTGFHEGAAKLGYPILH